MSKSIILVEVNLKAATNLKDALVHLGYDVLGIYASLGELLNILSNERVDLVLVDADLNEEGQGIDFVIEMNKVHDIPVVYLTSNKDAITVKRAMGTSPVAYLMKPYELSELVINIDLAIQNAEKKLKSISDEDVQDFEMFDEAIFVPDNQMHLRIDNQKIIAVEADGAYIKIITKEKTFQLSSNLKNFMRQFSDPSFIRLSRKHLINKRLVEKINGNTVYLDGHEFQFPKQSRQEILKHFKIIKTK